MSIRHYQDSHPSYAPNTFPVLYITVLIILIYSIFLVVRSVIAGADQSRQLLQQQSEIDQIHLKVEIAKRFITYQETPNYVEKEARQHFSYIKPGETVVAVPQNSDGSEELANEQAGRTAQSGERVVSPHLDQWWNYFFGK